MWKWSGSDYLHHLSNDTSNTLDDFYSECSIKVDCEVVQSIIDSTEGYINYNNPLFSYMPSQGRTVYNDYNLINNEYCKSIDDQNKCDQINQCEWNIDKCLIKIRNNTTFNNNFYCNPIINSLS